MNSPLTRLKRCRGCREIKPISSFPGDPVAKDGRRRACSACIAAGQHRPLVKSAATRQRDSEQAKAPHRRAANLAAVKRWQHRNRDAFLAARAVGLALKRGVIGKPARCQAKGCEYHGSRLQAHHPRYDLRLLVVWVCPSHHRALHNGHAVDLLPGLPAALVAVPPTLTSISQEASP